MILRGKYVAACPAQSGSKRGQRFDQHGRLNGHVKRAGDPHSAERFLRGVFFPDGHQSGHLLLGNSDFLAAPVGEIDIGDFEIVRFCW
jgi:hypothetical protein